MTKATFALAFALSAFAALPAVGAEQFQCPFPSNPNNPAKLEQIRGLLPDVNTMTNIERLTTTIAALRRDGMPKILIIDHLVGAYCPMVVRDAPLTEAEKSALVRRFTGQVTRLVYSLGGGLDIIINVPLTRDVVDAVNSIAGKQAFRDLPGSP